MKMQIDRLEFAENLEELTGDLRRIEQDLSVITHLYFRKADTDRLNKETESQYSLLERSCSDLKRIKSRLVGLQDRLTDSQDYLNKFNYKSIFFTED